MFPRTNASGSLPCSLDTVTLFHNVNAVILHPEGTRAKNLLRAAWRCFTAFSMTRQYVRERVWRHLVLIVHLLRAIEGPRNRNPFLNKNAEAQNHWLGRLVSQTDDRRWQHTRRRVVGVQQIGWHTLLPKAFGKIISPLHCTHFSLYRRPISISLIQIKILATLCAPQRTS